MWECSEYTQHSHFIKAGWINIFSVHGTEAAESFWKLPFRLGDSDGLAFGGVVNLKLTLS